MKTLKRLRQQRKERARRRSLMQQAEMGANVKTTADKEKARLEMKYAIDLKLV